MVGGILNTAYHFAIALCIKYRDKSASVQKNNIKCNYYYYVF